MYAYEYVLKQYINTLILTIYKNINTNYLQFSILQYRVDVIELYFKFAWTDEDEVLPEIH